MRTRAFGGTEPGARLHIRRRLERIRALDSRSPGSLSFGPMSAKNPNAELPPDTVPGEYVELDVDLFLKAFSTVLMTVKLPHADGFAPGLGVAIEGLPPVVLEDTPFNRGMDTAARLFAGADQRLSFAWRMVVVMAIAME